MLKLKEIKKVYVAGDNKVEALKGVSLDFSQNEFVSILGPSGCGKTTLLNIVGGLDRYTSGDLIIDGKSTKNFSASDWDTYRNHKIGFVFQNYNLIQHLNVLENVEIALTLSGVSKQERQNRAKEALERVGLLDQIKKMPNQLSGGQMQRVAIARALVNQPTIILADEPTGALDTKTSKQIMELLKEISKDKLIVMVTHNAKLAKKYSGRIINLIDGKVKNEKLINLEADEKNEQNNAKNLQTNQKKSQKTAENLKKDKKSSLNFWTALYLSLKNLLTKKGRTFLTSFAGSIGIIGVALVLSISNGFSIYINQMQSDTLSGYPISVTTAAVDLASLDLQEIMQIANVETVDDAVNVTGDLTQYVDLGHYNCINQNFLDYVKDYEEKNVKNNPNSNLSHIEYTYYAPIKFLIRSAGDMIVPFANQNKVSILSGATSNFFYPEITNPDFIMESYDVVYQSNEYDADDMFGLTLVLNKGNKLPYSVLEVLGITLQRDAETDKYLPVQFEDICERVDIQLMYNDNFYIYDEVNDTFGTIAEESLKEMFDSNILPSLKVTRIISPKKDSNSSLLSAGIMYTHALHEHYLQNCKESEIATKQAERKQSQLGTGNYTFYASLELVMQEEKLEDILHDVDLNSTFVIQYFLDKHFHSSISIEEAYQMGMQQIGVSEIPQSVLFYPKNFDARDEIKTLIDNYNASVEDDVYKIVYTDSTSLLSNTLGTIINIISIVLIAFASISLVVSSIMIGIITYVSVIERTKEIGILRSIGARKRDISRIFNAETIIIGALSGFIGVGITYILSPIISAIVYKLAGISGIATFSPIHAIMLILISMGLTLISGSIPSRIASKKDPVECLRTE